VQFIMLDRTLAAYGPETKDARKLLKQLLTERMSLIWPEKGGSVSLAVLGGAKKFLLNQINPGGMFLGRVLLNQHLSTDARDIIRIVMAMLATLSAVVLGWAKQDRKPHQAAQWVKICA
jgi:hypothetical protein